jgi:hypothetical protein
MRSWESEPRPTFFDGRAESHGRMDQDAACHGKVNEPLRLGKKGFWRVQGLVVDRWKRRVMGLLGEKEKWGRLFSRQPPPKGRCPFGNPGGKEVKS